MNCTGCAPEPEGDRRRPRYTVNPSTGVWPIQAGIEKGPPAPTSDTSSSTDDGDPAGFCPRPAVVCDIGGAYGNARLPADWDMRRTFDFSGNIRVRRTGRGMADVPRAAERRTRARSADDGFADAILSWDPYHITERQSGRLARNAAASNRRPVVYVAISQICDALGDNGKRRKEGSTGPVPLQDDQREIARAPYPAGGLRSPRMVVFPSPRELAENAGRVSRKRRAGDPRAVGPGAGPDGAGGLVRRNDAHRPPDEGRGSGLSTHCSRSRKSRTGTGTKIYVTGRVASGKTMPRRGMAVILGVPHYELDCVIHADPRMVGIKRRQQTAGKSQDHRTADGSSKEPTEAAGDCRSGGPDRVPRPAPVERKM